jgi:hypothetical protein
MKQAVRRKNAAVDQGLNSAPLRLTLLAGTAVAWLTSVAHAAPVLPAVSYSIYPTVVSSNISVPGSYSGEFCSPYNGLCAYSSASATPNQVLTVSGTSAGSDNLGANANSAAQMAYWYSVNGPANVPVPLRISGFIDLAVEGPSTWMIGRIWYTTASNPGGVLFQACASDLLYVCQANNVHLDHSSTSSIQRTLSDQLYYVTANSLQAVDLSIGGNASPAGGPGGQYNGVVDPVIVIDPVFLAANPDYSLSFSEGLAAVPVPGALVLFGTALGALALRVRHKVPGRNSRSC